MGVPAFNLTRAQLKESIRMLRECGYTAHRTGNTDTDWRDNDTSVLIERTDGKTEDVIMKSWERW